MNNIETRAQSKITAYGARISFIPPCCTDHFTGYFHCILTLEHYYHYRLVYYEIHQPGIEILSFMFLIKLYGLSDSLTIRRPT